MDRALKEKQVLDRQRQDKLISTVAQTLTSAVNTKLERVVKTEMKNQVVPGKAGRERGRDGGKDGEMEGGTDR